MQVQCGIELPKGTENLLGCSHKRGLKAKITEGVDWPRAWKHSFGEIMKQLSASLGYVFFENVFIWIRKVFSSNMFFWIIINVCGWDQGLVPGLSPWGSCPKHVDGTKWVAGKKIKQKIVFEVSVLEMAGSCRRWYGVMKMVMPLTFESGKSQDVVSIVRTVCTTSMQPGSQGEWTGMHMCEQCWLHCTSQWGSRHCWVSMCPVWLSHSKWLS